MHPAEEVYVTGTFDNWEKSVQLDKVGSSFEKTVPLPDTTDKIFYKVGAGSFMNVEADGKLVEAQIPPR